jgi:hypothetical protein
LGEELLQVLVTQTVFGLKLRFDTVDTVCKLLDVSGRSSLAHAYLMIEMMVDQLTPCWDPFSEAHD